VAAFGLALALILAPAVSSPLPGLLPLAFRIVAALLAAFLVYLAVRSTTRRVGPTPLGGTPEAVFVLLAFTLGLLASPGRAEAPLLAASLATGVAGADMLAFAKDPLRLGAGGMLGLLAAGMAAAWMAGTAGDLAQVALGSAILAAAAAGAWLSIMTFKVRGELDLSVRPQELRELG
jgi:hypothetical protein